MVQQLLKTIRYKLKYGCTVEWYNFRYIMSGQKQKIIPQVASIDETIDYIIEHRCSVSRYGDGELLLTNPQKAIGFQKGSTQLAERLKEIIQSNHERHLVCISDTFTDMYRYTRSCRRFWRTHFFLYGNWWDTYLVNGKRYYNTFITRPYMDYVHKEQSARWFQQLKAIWSERDVVFIEGEKSRLGVGNDLFENTQRIRRIICPPQNAFDHYRDILSEAMKLEKEVLILIALGPTATVLAYDLFKAGYQAIDIGHVDIEYEWWRMGAKRKVKLARKYVNEAPNGKEVMDAGDVYQSQIIKTVG